MSRWWPIVSKNPVIDIWYRRIMQAIIFETVENAQAILDKEFPGYTVAPASKPNSVVVSDENGQELFQLTVKY